MGRRVGIDRESVVTTAVGLVEDGGLESLSLGSVARHLGIQTPSLYHHIGGVDALKREVALVAAGRLAAALRSAHSGGATITGLADAYRRFALDHPGLYDALLPAPTPSDDPELAGAMYSAVSIVSAVLARSGLDSSTEAVRALRSALHGFVMLERSGGFGLGGDLDESFSKLVRVVVTGLEAEVV